MRQALHIFGKDIRLMTYEIGTTLVLLATFVYFELRSARAVDVFGPEMGLLVIAAWVLIVRVIQGEVLTGTRPFWLTRPYSRASLLAAKLLFVLAFVNLPKLVADAIIVGYLGFPIATVLPGLLWSQVLLFGTFVLPVMAIAALTSNMVQAMFGSLLFVIMSMPGFGSGLGPLDWIMHSATAVLVTMAAGIVVGLQYSLRRTGWVRLAAATLGVAIFVGVLSIPHTVIFALQSRWAKLHVDVRRVGIEVNTVDARATKYSGASFVRVHFPLRITGIPDGMAPRFDGTQLRIYTGDGTSWPPPGQPAMYVGFDVVNQEPRVSFEVPPEFYQKLKASPAVIRGTVYVTLFGNRVTATIRPEPVLVPGVGRCSIERFPGPYTQMGTICVSAFRSPPRLISVIDQPLMFYSLSYSPFPAELSISPISGIGPMSVDAPSESVLTTLEPLAHFTREVEFRGVDLREVEVQTQVFDR